MQKRMVQNRQQARAINLGISSLSAVFARQLLDKRFGVRRAAQEVLA